MSQGSDGKKVPVAGTADRQVRQIRIARSCFQALPARRAPEGHTWRTLLSVARSDVAHCQSFLVSLLCTRGRLPGDEKEEKRRRRPCRSGTET